MAALQVLTLSAAEDLICNNLMCEKLGDPCVCKLSVALNRMKILERLDLSNNRLVTVPEAICTSQLPHLSYLNLANNSLSSVPAELFKMPSLKVRALQICCNHLCMLLHNVETIPAWLCRATARPA